MRKAAKDAVQGDLEEFKDFFHKVNASLGQINESLYAERISALPQSLKKGFVSTVRMGAGGGLC